MCAWSMQDNSCSIAQWCPEDILREVMSYVWEDDAARCSLVCRGWLHACRAQLYTRVYFMSRARKARRLLARTLHTSLHLQEFIRELSIGPDDDDGSLYSWFPTLASLGNLHYLEVYPVDPVEGFQEIFSSTPPLLSVKHIYLDAGFCRYLTVQRILEKFPNADSFALDLDNQICDVSHPTRVIRRISIRSSLVDRFFPFMEAYASTLTRLDIDTRASTDEESLTHTLLHMTHLVSLSVIIPSTPAFLDRIVLQLPHLCELHCMQKSISSTLLWRLLSQIHTLRLLTRSGSFYLAAIEQMIRCSRARKTSLRMLVLQGSNQELERIKTACVVTGIQFDNTWWFHLLRR